MSDNGKKERCPLGLKLLHILCTGTGHNKNRNYVLPYYVHNIKKIFEYHKRKTPIYSCILSYFSESCFVTERRKTSILIRQYQRMSVLSNFPWLLFRMISAFLNAQLFLSQKIYCLSDNFIILPYAVSRIHDMLQEFFFCLWFFPIGCVLYVPTKYLRGHEIWWACRPSLWLEMSMIKSSSAWQRWE